MRRNRKIEGQIENEKKRKDGDEEKGNVNKKRKEKVGMVRDRVNGRKDGENIEEMEKNL